MLLAYEVNPESEELRYKYNLIFFFLVKNRMQPPNVMWLLQLIVQSSAFFDERRRSDTLGHERLCYLVIALPGERGQRNLKLP